MTLRSKTSIVGTSDVSLLLMPASQEGSLHGLVFQNNTAGSLNITVRHYDQSEGVTTEFITAKPIASKGEYVFPKPINLEAGDEILAVASGASIVAQASWYIGTAAPAAVGLTPRGDWTSVATYAVNDIVNHEGTSYIALEINTNSEPPSVDWMILAAEGGAGSVGGADEIPFTPAGGIVATDVQAAIEELDAEKEDALGFTPEDSADKGVANGYASLDSGGKVPTTQLPASVVGGLNYQGTWNASTNSPSIPAAAAANKGWYYRVSTAGTTSIDGIAEWAIGDWIVSNGTVWEKVDNTDAVSSVAGKTGVVTLDSTDVGLSNVPNVDARARSSHTGTQLASTISDLAAVATTGSAASLTTGTLDKARLHADVLRKDQTIDCGGQTLRNYRAGYVEETGTAWSAADATHNGRVIIANNASPITVTLPSSLPVGFNMMVIQWGAGSVTFSAGAGATLRHPDSHTKIEKQYAAVTLEVPKTAGEVLMNGRTIA